MSSVRWPMHGVTSRVTCSMMEGTKRQEKGTMRIWSSSSRPYVMRIAATDTISHIVSLTPPVPTCGVKVQRKSWCMGMNTTNSRPLGEMAFLIVGFYWLLYTPFASIYGNEWQHDSYSWCSQRWHKRGMCLRRLHISAASGVALELGWKRTAGCWKRAARTDRRSSSI